MTTLTKKRIPPSSIIKFLIPSLIGIILFIVPIQYEEAITIPIAIMSGILQDVLGSYLPAIMTIIIILALAGTVLAKTVKPAFMKNSPFFTSLFDVQPVWFIARILGAVFAVLTLFKAGPEWIWSNDTGGLLLGDLLPVLFSVFLFAGLFLPLLLNFGLLEFFGALLAKFMRPVFKLPGRSSIDCLASWLGDGTIGVLLTSKQYEEGFYTKREAAVIGTTFSVVSITFSIVIIEQVKLQSYFFPFYLTIAAAGIVAAIICPRIPPLSRKADTYANDEAAGLNEEIPAEYSRAGWGLKIAADKAAKSRGVKEFFKDGSKNVLDMWMGVAPIVMALGTIALIIAEFTPVFKWLGLPFIPLLQLLQVPEAAAASQTIMVGFADMFLPSVIGSDIESDLTRFIIAALSVTQLIYMSEVGGLLLGSKIPVSFWELFVIFLQRTIITLPVIVIAAHLLF
ncbi:YjiH family protein [Metabacillus sp. 113a]|uniref:YjiH family protein n=1 Tax=Metabacillus sp. 113a TaxID=3404706 RepID=UPI003CF2675A